MAQHRLELSTEVLDQVVKSLMQSVTANTKRRRRIGDSSKEGMAAKVEGDLLAEGLNAALRAQSESW